MSILERTMEMTVYLVASGIPDSQLSRSCTICKAVMVEKTLGC